MRQQDNEDKTMFVFIEEVLDDLWWLNIDYTISFIECKKSFDASSIL